MARDEELTDEQWAFIEPHLPELPSREDGRGGPWRENREVMDGILWILRSGARWKDLPGRFPPYQTATADSRGQRQLERLMHVAVEHPDAGVASASDRILVADDGVLPLQVVSGLGDVERPGRVEVEVKSDLLCFNKYFAT